MKHAIYITIFIILLIAGWYALQSRTQMIPGGTPDGEELEIEEEREEQGEEEVKITIEDVVGSIENLAQDFDERTPFVIQRVWVQEDNLYAEYRNNEGMLAQLLIVPEDEGWRGVGYFTPSESGWVLQAGEGELVGAGAVLYERDEEGKWERKN